MFWPLVWGELAVLRLKRYGRNRGSINRIIFMTRLSNLIDGGSLQEHVDADRNRDVLAYLERAWPSCHSDNSSVLVKAAIDRCGEWLGYCPSLENYGYVALITNRVVFALGIGQSCVCFKLSDRLRATALTTGAAPAEEIGREWVTIQLFRPDWPDPDVPFWTLKAYSAARHNDE